MSSDDQVLQHRRVDRAARAQVIRHQARERALEPFRRHGLRHVGDPLDAVTQQAHIAAYECRENVDHRGLLDLIEPADCAEVDEAERAVVERKHVSRMRIGVEEAEHEHLVERRAEQLLRELFPVDLRRVELRGIGQGEAFEALLYQEAPGAELAIHLRNAHRGTRAEEH